MSITGGHPSSETMGRAAGNDLDQHQPMIDPISANAAAEGGRFENWRTLAGIIHTGQDAPKLPRELLGLPWAAEDAELCLAKGEVLVRSGDLNEGSAWLRAAPDLAV